MKLLSDVEVLKILEANIPTFAARKVAQAQLDSCEAEHEEAIRDLARLIQEERERIIQEIADYIKHLTTGTDLPNELQSLKERIRSGL